MTEETPPAPLPRAAEAPYPPQPAPHGAANDIRVTDESKPVPVGIGPLGVTLIGGAVAATIGLLIAVPFLKRRNDPGPRRQRQSPRGRKTD